MQNKTDQSQCTAMIDCEFDYMSSDWQGSVARQAIKASCNYQLQSLYASHIPLERLSILFSLDVFKVIALFWYLKTSTACTATSSTTGNN